MHRRRRRLTFLAGLLLFLPACSDRLLAPEPSAPEAAPPPPAAAAQEVERLARALAVALGDPELRLRVLRDLRDSPFPNHKLHLNSYRPASRMREAARISGHTDSATRERIHQDPNNERVRAEAAEARRSMRAFLAEGDRPEKKTA